MYLLSIIDKIYENSHFTTILVVSIIILVLLFAIVLVLGLKDAKKSKEPVKKKEEEVKDITFENLKDVEAVKEDVTFDIPVLTKNLEDFKRNFEEEITKEQEIEVRKTSHESLNDSTKPVKILDIGLIEDTAVLSNLLPEKEPESEAEDLEDRKEIFSTKNFEEKLKIDDAILQFFEDDDF